MNYKFILLDQSNHVGLLTLNRPKKLNTLNHQLYKEIVSGIKELDSIDEVRVIIIKANGKAFCAGGDISEAKQTPFERLQESPFAAMSQAIAEIKKPVISAVHGAVVAGGCGLALSCDIVVAADNAKFGLTAINAGLFCFGPAVPLLYSVGRKKSFELLFTGDVINAKEAEQIGMINKVVPIDMLESEAIAMAEKISSKNPSAVQMAKRSLYNMIDMEYKTALDYSESMIAILSSTEEADEGIKAFFEKRKPKWNTK